MPIELSLEDKLILACVSEAGETTSLEGIHQIDSSKINIDLLISKANRHACLAHVYYRLLRDKQGLPESLLASVKSDVLLLAQKNITLDNALVELIDNLSSAGIQAISFKGGTLAKRLYDEPTHRPYNDIDILINPYQIGLVRDFLLGLGYREKTNYSDVQRKNLERYHYESAFVHPQLNFLVEIHEAFIPKRYFFDFDHGALLDRNEAVILQDKKLATLDAQDLLYGLCIHNCKDGWYRLIHLVDIYHLIKKTPNLDIMSVIVRASRDDARSLVLVNLLLVKKLFPDTIDVLKAFESEFSTRINAIADDIIQLLFNSDGVVDKPLKLFGLQLRVRDTFKIRLKMVWAAFSEPSVDDVEWISLPSNLSFLYCLLRPFRMLLKYCGVK